MLELEQAQLRERFETLLAQEQQALLTYESLLAQAIDPELRAHVETLCRDKLRHVELAERLLEIVD